MPVLAVGGPISRVGDERRRGRPLCHGRGCLASRPGGLAPLFFFYSFPSFFLYFFVLGGRVGHGTTGEPTPSPQAYSDPVDISRGGPIRVAFPRLPGVAVSGVLSGSGFGVGMKEVRSRSRAGRAGGSQGLEVRGPGLKHQDDGGPAWDLLAAKIAKRQSFGRLGIKSSLRVGASRKRLGPLRRAVAGGTGRIPAGSAASILVPVSRSLRPACFAPRTTPDGDRRTSHRSSGSV